MRRLHARKGMALAMLPALLLAAGGCTKTPVAPVSREAAALTWTIVDEAGGVGRGDFTGKAVTAVFSALDTPPVITYLTGDQSLLVSRMLALDELPVLADVERAFRHAVYVGDLGEQALVDGGQINSHDGLLRG